MCPFKSFNFVPSSQEAFDFLPPPQPAKNFFPSWLKTIPHLPYPYDDNPKNCAPFMDTFSHGYIQELAGDLEVKVQGVDEDGNTKLKFDYSLPLQIVSTRHERLGKKNLLPKFPGYYRSEQHWESFWEPNTPKGFSALYCHPLNRFDLPFSTFAGIIDTDRYPISGPIPFIIKEGFEGVIPAGTPIYQIIFIKRENWKSKKGKYDERFLKQMLFHTKRYLQGGYKKLFWVKKSFE